MRRVFVLASVIAIITACASDVPITSPVGIATDGTSALTAFGGPPSIALWVSRDTVTEGDSLVASADAFTGTKKSPSTTITWTWHPGWPTDTVASIGSIIVTPLNGKAQDVSIHGVRWGNVVVTAEWRDNRGALVTSTSAQLHVKSKVAEVGVCFLDPRVADSLGISGDTTVDPIIIAPFCLPTGSISTNSVRVRLRSIWFLDDKRVP